MGTFWVYLRKEVMANNENLIPIKKGEVRNPRGKKPGTLNNTTILRNILLAGMTAEEKKSVGKTFDPRIFLFKKLVEAGDSEKPSEVIMACKEMFDRIDGKAIAKIENIGDVPVTKVKIEGVEFGNNNKRN